MATLTIKLSKDQRAFIEEHLAETGCKSVDTFIDSLIRAEQRRRAEEKLVRLVREADESGPATPMTREDWDDLKRRVWQRHAQAKETSRGKSRQKNRRPARSR